MKSHNSYNNLCCHIGEIDLSKAEDLKIEWKSNGRISSLHGVEPDIAINSQNAVVIYRTGTQLLKTAVGTIKPNHSSIDWNEAEPLPSTGINPTVSMNSHGVIIAIHQTKLLRRLKQSYGKLLQDGTIGWKNTSYFSLGEYPTVSISDDNFVFEMHKTNFGFNLFQSQGILGKFEAESDQNDIVYPLQQFLS